MEKVILVVCDGLREDTAAASMGYLAHLVEKGLARRYSMLAEMPTVSRPLYETIQTGLPPYEHGITHNGEVRLSKQAHVFGLAQKQGLVTAAAAYSWVSELYNRCPFDVVMDRETDDVSLPIQHGRFYFTDDYPDAECFADAEYLVRRYVPDYLLVHPMGMDDVGHRFGAETPQYDNHASSIDALLGRTLPHWLESGYTVLVTADHGLNRYHAHGGTLDDVRRVPFVVVRPGRLPAESAAPLPQLCVAPTLCTLLGIKIPPAMRVPALVLPG